ncbi:MAG: glycosyltransferase family 4 protein [Bacteroidales bacterium]
MKVLILSTKLPYPPRDGGAIATLNLAKGLAMAGIEVSMLSFNTKKHYFDPRKIPEDICKLIAFHTITNDTSPRPLKAVLNLVFARTPYISDRFKSKNFTIKLKELLLSGNFNFVQMEGPYLAGYLPVVRSCSTARISLRAHNVEHEIWERRWKNESGLVARIYMKNLAGRIRKLEHRLLGQIDLLISISDRDQAILLSKHGSLPAITVPTGMDIAAYSFRNPGSARDICFIGALDWSPNQEGLRWFKGMVLPHLLEMDPAIIIHIAGRNAPAEFIRELDHPAITWHGEVDDAGKFMQEYGILAVPLLTGSGIRIKILEGMAQGICIVTTSIGAEGIPAEDGTHLLIGDDGKIFAEKLYWLLHNEDLAGNIADAARTLIKEKFDTFAVASDLGNLYKKMA